MNNVIVRIMAPVESLIVNKVWKEDFSVCDEIPKGLEEPL